jgi:hypothetical protein
MADRHCIESCQGNCIASAFGLREMKTVILLTLVALLPAACSRHKGGGPGASQQTTQTIAPASPQPTGPDTSGTDAMTQTVLVDDSRSESESMASASTTTVAKKPAAKVPAKKKGKK